MISLFATLPVGYILDGHHRFEASSKYLSHVGAAATEKDYWLQGLIYSVKYVRAFPQHRKLLRSENINIMEVLLRTNNLLVD